MLFIVIAEFYTQGGDLIIKKIKLKKLLSCDLVLIVNIQIERCSFKLSRVFNSFMIDNIETPQIMHSVAQIYPNQNICIIRVS